MAARDRRRALHRQGLLALCLAVAACAWAQEERPGTEILGILDTVIVAGNTSTETYVILNEMTLRRGSVVTPEAIQYDRSRIYGLGLFTRVEIHYDSLGSVCFLYVDVSERWHLIPVPIFGFRDGDPKKIYFGGGILHNNLRGRNQKLFAFLTLGYDPSLAISFSDPLFDHGRRLAFTAGASFARVRNRSEIYPGDFSVDNYTASVGLSKRFNLFETLGLNMGFRGVLVDEYEPGFTLNTGGKDLFLTATLAFTYDSRDLYEYASRGEFVELYITRNGFGEGTVGFFRMGADLRLYSPLPFGVTLLTRGVSTIVTGGTVPGYMHTFFGYGERIRGYYKTVFEGENLAGGTLELRIPLFGPRTYDVSSLGIPPVFAFWRLGLSLALFGDTGVTWFRGQKIGLRSLASGLGAGLDLLLPYSFVVRTSYAWSDTWQGEFILDLRRPL
jgi:outer membrane protein assembly factor BamA